MALCPLRPEMNTCSMGGASAKEYWERRFEGGVSLASVGWWGFGEPFNRWMYAVRRRIFLRCLRPFAVEGMNVLDVGSGSGFYVERWRELRALATASDMTTAAVEALRERVNAFAVQLDIGEPEVHLGRQFDAISMMDVLFHIVDDGRYYRSFRNAAALLRPGGLLVFSENLLHGPAIAHEHQVSRSMDQTMKAVSDAGFAVVVRRPMFVLMNTPLDSRSPALRRYWRGLERIIRHEPTHGYATGAVLFWPELIATNTLVEGPSTELVICRRR